VKKFLNHIKSRILAGLVFMVPLFAVLLVLQKLFTTLRGAGNYLVKLFGLQSLLGRNTVTIATAVLLVFLFYFCGWLVKIKSLNQMRDWIETKLLQFIPGYLTYKAQVNEKITPKQDSRIPVWVNTDSGRRPGLMVEEKPEGAIIFFPNSPDSNNGQVLLVAREKVTKLDIAAVNFIKSMQKFGKDLPVSRETSIEEKKIQTTTTIATTTSQIIPQT
jgi:uncharacterized membrane protein